MAKRRVKRRPKVGEATEPKRLERAKRFIEVIRKRKAPRCKICDADKLDRDDIETLIQMQVRGEGISLRDIEEFAVTECNWDSLSNSTIIAHRDKHLGQEKSNG